MRSSVADYELTVAPDLPSALTLLASGENWRPLAGGTDLMVLFNAGRLPFRRLIGLRKLRELQQIDIDHSSVTIGATASYSQIRQHPVLQAEFPLLCQAARWTGGIANQNQGTLGGNIANASPAADSAPPLLVYDAALQLTSLAGTRSVPYAQFHLGYKLCAMRPDELISSITLPRRAQLWHDRGRKVGTRQAQAISKVCFAASARIGTTGIEEVRLAFGSIAPVPLRCVATEGLLHGQRVTPALVATARESLLSEISPIDDIRSTASYRSRVAQNLLTEFLGQLA